MRIRKAKRKDIRQIAKLMLEEFRKPPFNEKASINMVLKSLNFYFKIGRVYVAINKNEIVGIVVFKIERYWEGPAIIIEDLAVKKDFKKQEIGKLLMNKVEDYAKKNKAKTICFKTNKKSSAVRFYKEYGYKLKNDIIYMEKKIISY